MSTNGMTNNSLNWLYFRHKLHGVKDTTALTRKVSHAAESDLQQWELPKYVIWFNPKSFETKAQRLLKSETWSSHQATKQNSVLKRQ